MIKKSKIKNQKSKIYGKELTLDLYDCDPKIIRSKKKILEYSNKLCDLMKVKKYGKPIIERFALHLDYAAGYSLVQLIESSLVSGHFSELWNGAYINIFSCKDFDDKKAAAFTKKFFDAKIIKKRTLIR
ncbi:MAG: S-adenosylmethionine decarboxylase [Candidatus Nealsonbacteria bacterium CG02_land_8_20_14_3_00_37_10]|uniref:S-adenosylmethionine decarboxylase n=2 Tax=Candidatus Nealsoniibacteriota TaxID=1817911 RepID=A0A2G9YY10_9BACT|nr:MAG: S-adenosylmethionine decarboxylase [Candidatus Nealsonbacteria bacterium CG23_combo_of_CG06-09_8_20_14_all_37_18]PIV44892.1 MAG: S-adenosylmethionine decarboxylase [Candidatus Nealsonbacteria bacterium CG02_land_8_20_14_3_00_37_10]